MLSSSTIKNAGQASHYFSEQDNYYSREEGLQQSEWWGKGSEQMGLSDGVSDKQFTNLLQGRLPNGEVLGKMVNGQLNHRPGWDLTFSAPKSVSIMALVGGDRRLMDAHREAVGVALSHIEQSCAQARVKTNGQMIYQNTGSLIGALYHHDLSRAKDPQMHTHSVIMNMTQRTDGKWRSLASSVGRYNEETTTEINGFIERVRHHNRYFSKVYEAELAFRVKQLGYEIRNDTASGIFEIADVPREVIDHFSTRRQEIEAKLEQKGLSGGKAAAMATLTTRDNKTKVDRDQLKQDWIAATTSYGVDLGKMIDQSIQQCQSKTTKVESVAFVHDKASSIIRDASQSLAVFQSTFSLEQVMTEAANAAIHHHVDIKTLLRAIDQETKNGNLISIANDQGKTLLMDKCTLEDEKNLVEQLKVATPLDRQVQLAHIENVLNKEIGASTDLHHSLTTIFNQDRVVMVEGEENKRLLIKPIMKISDAAQCHVAIVSPTLVGGKQLAKQLQQNPIGIWENIRAMFVDTTTKHYSAMQFLTQFDQKHTEQKIPDILLVDQAHLLSTHLKSELITWSNQHQTKIILFGNNENLLPHQVSTSLQALTELGVKTIHAPDKSDSLNSVQNDELLLTKLKSLSHQIVEVNAAEERHQSMAVQYSRLSSTERQSSWLVAPYVSGAEKLNQAAHDQLKKDGVLTKSIVCHILSPVYMAAEKAKLASSYATNQVIRFNDDYASLGVKRGEYLRITQMSKQSNRVILTKDNGERVVWRPDRVAAGTAGKVEVFQEKEREFSQGESVVLLRSMKAKGVVKGERCHIEAIRGGRATLRNGSGKSLVVDLSKPYGRHLDYGYASTLHAITHEKATTLIADLPGHHPQTDQRRLNQLLSQTKQLWLYTDDSKKLLSTIEKQTGDRLSANEIIVKAAAMKSSLHALYDILEKTMAKQSKRMETTHLHQAINAVDYAMKHLAERQAGFSHKELMQIALNHALGSVTETTLRDVTVAMQKANILLRGDRQDGTLWTTAEAVKIEREIMQLSQQDKGKMRSIASDTDIQQYTDTMMLRAEQIDAIKSIVMSTDRVLSIQGRAGTGKTTMMTSLESVLTAKTLFTESGYTLRGLAPTHKAVKELTARGIQSQTIDSFLQDMRKMADSQTSVDFTKTLFVIDEASMVSNRKMLDVLRLAHEHGFCRVIPTGDVHQNPSIEAGKPHDLIQRTLAGVIHLNDIQRQKNPILKQAVLALYEGKIKQSFALLDQHIVEIGGPEKASSKQLPSHEQAAELKLAYGTRVKTLVNDYFELTAQGEEVQIIAPAHDDRKAINAEVRAVLKEAGTLKGEAYTFTVFSSKDMSLVERSKANNFKTGDVIKFASASGKHIQAGDYFHIKSINPEHNGLTLTKVNGDSKEIFWQVPQSSKKLNAMVEVFKREDRSLQVGDKITWTRTNKNEGLISTEVAEVTQIDQSRISAKRLDQSVMVFDAKDPRYQHWDHAYALTTYSTQGGTYSTVLGFFESYRKNLMNLKTFLVTVTRAVNQLRIYTDDKAKLQSQVIGNAGNKLSSLEVIGDYPNQASRRSSSQKQAYHEKTGLSDTAQGSTDSVATTAHSRQSIRQYDRYTVDRIVAGLNKDAEKIATNILGKPKLCGNNFAKYGSHQGSLSVTTKGEHQGWWNDFSDNAGGRSMLSFLQKYAGFSKQEALDFGAKWVGIDPSITTQNTPRSPQKSLASIAQPEVTVKDSDKKKIAYAQKLAGESQPIKDTVVARYLKEQRVIDLQSYPEDIRFHPGIYSKLNGKTLPAMLVIARDYLGDVKAVQATYLDPATASKVDKSLVAVQKQTFGAMKGAAVTIAGAKNAPTIIAEGIETGLSLKQAIPQASIKITLSKSNFKNIDMRMLSDKTILCLDDDGKNLKQDKVILESAKRLVAGQKEVSLMVPAGGQHTKQDYNDVLKMQGIQPIKADFDSAISIDRFYGKAIQVSPAKPIEQTKINLAAKQFQADDKRNNEQLADTYRSLSSDVRQREVANVSVKQLDTERTI